NDSSLPGVYRLSKRSIEMKPSAFSSSGFNSAAMSRYSSRAPSAGKTSNITAIMARSPLASSFSDGKLLRELRERVELGPRGAAGDRFARFRDPVADRVNEVRRIERRP